MTSDIGVELDQAANAAAMKELQHYRKHGELFPTIYTTKVILENEFIQGNAIEVRLVPLSDIDTDSFLVSKQQLVGRIALTEMQAGQLVRIDNLEPAERYYQRQLQTAEIALGPTSLEVARLLNLMADSYWNNARLISHSDVGRYVLAEELQRRALSVHEELCGIHSAEAGEDCLKIASLCKRQEKWSEWKRFLERALEIYEMTNQDTSKILAGLASYYENDEDRNKMEEYVNLALAAQEKALCKSLISLQSRLYHQASMYCRFEKYTEAELVHRRLIAMTGRMFGENNIELVDCLKYYAQFLQERGRTVEAEQMLARANAIDGGTP